jgi:hypothetical protein
MFEEFTKKKFDEYLNSVQFPDGRINILKLRNYSLPSFIINFFECSFPKNTVIINRDEFKSTLRKAIIFNINYISKPKATILKFVFGELETRPAEYVKHRLTFFQFYNYYISHIEDFINLNSPMFISKNQIEHLIDEINEKILQEIINPASDNSQRLNLIKLLYYYFLELTNNNPVNIKLPKKLLSVFFSDKGYIDIKKRVDAFFSDEIFIQEAIELMKPVKKDDRKSETDEIDDKTLHELVGKAKMSMGHSPGTSLLNSELSDKDIEQTLHNPDPELKTGEQKNIIKDIADLKTSSTEKVELLDKKVILDENIYSDALLFESQLNETVKPEPRTEGEIRIKRLNDIFCEETYRKKIIKKIFKKDETIFKGVVLKILEAPTWKEASDLIGEYFDNNRINYYSPEAVKFVDLIENHYNSDINFPNLKQGFQKS